VTLPSTAQILTANHQWKEAQKHLQDALRVEPKFVGGLLRVLLLLNLFEPVWCCRHVGASVLLGQCQLRLGNAATALHTFDGAFANLQVEMQTAKVITDTTSCGFSALDILTWMARAFKSNDDHGSAIAVLTKVIEVRSACWLVLMFGLLIMLQL